MIRSVRGRLTVVVALVSGGLAVGAAFIAPETVRSAMINDRLDAEVSSDGDTFHTLAIDRRTGTDGGLTAARLTTYFGPEIAQLTDALASTEALAALRAFDDEQRILVTPAGNVIGQVSATGTIRVDLTDRLDQPGPVVTLRRLRQLAAEHGRPTRFGTPLAPLDPLGADTTLNDLLSALDDRFGSGIADQLDRTVFEQFAGFDLDTPVPGDLFELLEDVPLAVPEDDPRPDLAPAPLADDVADDHVYGTRPIGGFDVIVSSSAEGIGRSVDRVRAMLWAAVPFTMLVAGGVTWLLAGRALRPVRTMTERTRRIRSSTLHERIPVPTAGDELTALATEMNTMLDRIHREDERRRQFVADASHELRSPLAAIRTQAEAALAEAGDGDDHEVATGILAEAERMSTLVDDLLSLARHDEALAAPGTPLDLDDIVLSEAARPRRIPVDVGAVSAGQVRGRTDELTRAVAHLLDNAVRHARSHVAVALEATGDHVMLSVDDDGPGVPLEHRDRIFERFVRLDAARERDSGGAGLGLAVVASVVQAGGGDVTVTDSVLGGARFTIVLPAVG